jgi:hypothetical protein
MLLCQHFNTWKMMLGSREITILSSSWRQPSGRGLHTILFPRQCPVSKDHLTVKDQIQNTITPVHDSLVHSSLPLRGSG